ncbi:Zn-ribbon domain-containing OB-fold protein [Neobacillus vireti]|uniref:Zn-ribbon domain-containing OB-fold protein n=1 Tax=Neobacillus vireti TaxID=220686 RepID=UPI002FFF1A7C
MAINYINKETKEFYEGANRSELLIQKCDNCGEYVFYPRAICPKDMGNLSFVKASGKGKILTYSIVRMDGMPRFKDMVPYAAALVELEEGPTIGTRIVVNNPEEVFIGQEVEVLFEEQDSQKIPLFRPVGNVK